MDVTNALVAVLNELEHRLLSEDYHHDWTEDSFLAQFSHEARGAEHFYTGKLSALMDTPTYDEDIHDFLTAFKSAVIGGFSIDAIEDELVITLVAVDIDYTPYPSIEQDEDGEARIIFHDGYVMVVVKESGEENPVGIITEIWIKSDDGEWLMEQGQTYWYD